MAKNINAISMERLKLIFYDFDMETKIYTPIEDKSIANFNQICTVWVRQNEELTHCTIACEIKALTQQSKVIDRPFNELTTMICMSFLTTSILNLKALQVFTRWWLEVLAIYRKKRLSPILQIQKITHWQEIARRSLNPRRNRTYFLMENLIRYFLMNKAQLHFADERFFIGEVLPFSLKFLFFLK